MEFLFAGVSTLIIFFIVLTLSERHKSISDWIMLAWFGVMLIDALAMYIMSTPQEKPYLILALSGGLSSLHWPIIWLYTRSLIYPNFKFQFRDVIHLIVPLGMLGYYFFLHRHGYSHLLEILNPIRLVLLLVYLGLTATEIRRHQKRVPQLFSSKKEVDLSWLYTFMLCVVVALLISLVSQLLIHLAGWEIPHYGGLYLHIGFAIMVFFLGIKGLRQSQIYPELVNLPMAGPTLSRGNGKKTLLKYENSGLCEEKARDIYQQVHDFVKENKIYLDPQLSLARLSKQTGFPSHHLSQAINTYAHLNFFDYVNQFRVEDVKEKIQDDANHQYTLLALAMDSGFNSKASFNRAFKKFTGMTPSEYRRNVNTSFRMNP